MSNLNSSADTLLHRFIEEQEYIQKYMELLRRKASIDSLEINKVIYSLESYNLAKRDGLLRYLLYGQSYSIDELKEFNLKLQQLKPQIQATSQESVARLNQLKRPDDINKVHAASLTGECISYLTDILEYDSTLETIEAARKELKEQLRKQDAEPVFVVDELGSYDQLVDYAIEGAIYILQANRSDGLIEILDSIEDIDITIRMYRSDTEINLFRQGFIALTTIFDATVFDLMRIALKGDFFNLIALFGRQDKVSLEKLSKYSSLDEFRDEIIEEQLKSRYLKEILFILNGNKITLTDTTQGDEFIHLLEMVLRRNIHIHNRGVVDSKYLELNDNGVPRFNVYGLTLGTVAHIDSAYWDRANRLSLNCIKLIADWINTLPPPF